MSRPPPGAARRADVANSEPSARFFEFLELAVTSLAEGEAERALAAASEACLCSPDRPKAHYLYGQAWLALNQPARAQAETLMRATFARWDDVTPHPAGHEP
jgi:hypothetical protein